MSAAIWMEIDKAVKEVKPEASAEFQTCRNRETIVAFLEKHFPFKEEENTSWGVQLMSQTPDILRKRNV